MKKRSRFDEDGGTMDLLEFEESWCDDDDDPISFYEKKLFF